MYKNQRIVVGIVTCSRPATFKPLLEVVLSCKQVDEVEVVKNKDFNYGDADPMKILPDHTTAELRDVGVGACKNIAIKKLLDSGCQHIFIVEDDVKIKRYDVFEAYIQTAEEFNIEHLNFGGTYDQLVHHDYLKPYLSLKHGNYAIDLYRRLSGVFSYFTAQALREVGLLDEQYINALEHCEHTYRMSIAGKCPPFYSFADMHRSSSFLEDLGTTTTIEHGKLYNERLKAGTRLFCQQHGMFLSQVPIPTNQQVVDYLDARLSMKKGT